MKATKLQKVSASTNNIKQKINYPPSVSRVYDTFTSSKTIPSKVGALLSLLDLCYNNKIQQQDLCDKLGMLYSEGPISINSMPDSLIRKANKVKNDEDQFNQLEFLFNFLKDVKEYYFCWVIYFNEELKILNLKLFKKQEVDDEIMMFNPHKNLIGIFVGRTKKQPKLLKKSMNLENKMNSLSVCLNNETNNSTKQTWKDKNQKCLSKIDQLFTSEKKQNNFKKYDKKVPQYSSSNQKPSQKKRIFSKDNKIFILRSKSQASKALQTIYLKEVIQNKLIPKNYKRKINENSKKLDLITQLRPFPSITKSTDKLEG